MGSSQSVVDNLHMVMPQEMEVKWSLVVETIVSINVKNHDGNIFLHQHLLLNQLIKGYTCMAYLCRCTPPEEALESNTGESVDETM